MKKLLEECVTGGLAASGACLFSNPLEVVKTRMQLQGELQARGSYAVHYRNVFHAFYTIGKVDGLSALQKGLVPGVMYQFVMNGLRLGSFQVFTDMGFTKTSQGDVSYFKTLMFGATAGCIGALVGSPGYMIKTQLQAQATSGIAVGTQHNITSISSTLRSIYSKHGIIGVWRGASAAVARVGIGSAVQLSSFSKSKEFIRNQSWFENDSILVPFTASMLAGLALVGAMTPFDVVSTRVYNQGVSTTGDGLLYNGFLDVFKKIYKREGLMGFYKGSGAHYFRIGPHTTLSLVFWEQLKRFVKIRKEENS